MKLKNRVAIVTGGGSGIGRSIALTFAENGAKIVIADINMGSAEEVVIEIEKADGESIAIGTNVSNRESTENLVRTAVEKYGKVDILVNSAGVSIVKPMLEITEIDWDTTIDTNLKGAFLCCKSAIRVMVNGGKIINIASSLGEAGLPNQAAYCASKGGVIALTRALACEFGPVGINVNAIAPGVVMTPMTEQVLKDEIYRKTLVKQIPVRRVGVPQDIASVALFLASDESQYINGEILSVDGGLLAALRTL